MKAAAPIGCAFTFLCLVTGSLWGKPMWGAWWVWDARLTSVLVLLLIYLGILAIWNAIEDQGHAARVAAIATLVGFVNIPIVKFSVEWWNTLHQGASVFTLDGSKIAPEIFLPLLVMACAFTLSCTSRCISRRCATRSCAAGCAGSPSSPPRKCRRAAARPVEEGVRA